MLRFCQVLSILILTVILCPLPSQAVSEKNPEYDHLNLAVPAPVEIRVHNVGRLHLSISNYGKIGSQSLSLTDPCTGYPAPSAEFPAGSAVNYLFQGGIWIGAIVGEGVQAETLVSVGVDGWQQDEEFNPLQQIDALTDRVTGLQQGVCLILYSELARSQQDYYTAYRDTFYDPFYIPPSPFDGAFKSLSVEVLQRTYAWSEDFGDEFVLFDFEIKNARDDTLYKVYVGMFVDSDVHNIYDGAGYFDDISGFLHSYPSSISSGWKDTLNLAWSADNDGAHNNGPIINPSPVYSPLGVTGTRFLNVPDSSKFSFNWWISQGDANLDWGPWTQASAAKRFDNFYGVLGTPEGNANKYFMMSNGEIDYDQLFSCLDWTSQGWLGPHPYSPLSKDFANGYDTRYLLTFGPFDLAPGDSIPLAFAYVAGEDFHLQIGDADNVDICDSASVFEYYNRLDFSDIAANALWAGWTYDNPGVDTDKDGFKGDFRFLNGDTIFHQGDGVPDFSGPQPPPIVKPKITTPEGKIIIEWDGYYAENQRDIFSREKDFEGYRIYFSYTGQPGDYTILDSYDRIDFKLLVFNPDTQKWKERIASLTPDSLVKIFASDHPCCLMNGNSCVCDSDCSLPGGFGDDPQIWTVANPYTVNGSCGDVEVSPNFTLQAGDKIAFEPQDWNIGLNDLKLYREGIENGSVTPADREYYQYRYVLEGVNPTQTLWLALTSFDYGYAQVELEGQESGIEDNAYFICINKAGDLDSSGDITLADAIHLINYHFGKDRFPCHSYPPFLNCWEPEAFCRADVNGSGKITVEDIVYLLNYFLHRPGYLPPVAAENCCSPSP